MIAKNFGNIGPHDIETLVSNAASSTKSGSFFDQNASDDSKEVERCEQEAADLGPELEQAADFGDLTHSQQRDATEQDVLPFLDIPDVLLAS